MRRALCTTTASLALGLALAACGSSGTSSAGTAATSSAGAAATSSAATATAPATTTTAAPHSSASNVSGGFKVAKTPKFASPEPSAPVQSGVVQIAYRDIAIAPDTLRVKVGSTIRWTNYDSVDHNVTSIGPGPQKFASKEFGENGTFEIKVEKPGVIHYESTTQPTTMNGTIEVVK
jgi:plastocyanin